MTQLLELRGVVEAPPDAVAGLLLDVRRGGRSPLTAGMEAEDGDGGRLVIVRDGSHLTVTVDRAAREVTEQSEWWFRSTTTVEPDPRGSQVVHRIFDVAEGNGRAVRFLSRGPLNAAPARFAEVLRRLGAELGAATRVL
jgi:hypothetical protein